MNPDTCDPDELRRISQNADERNYFVVARLSELSQWKKDHEDKDNDRHEWVKEQFIELKNINEGLIKSVHKGEHLITKWKGVKMAVAAMIAVFAFITGTYVEWHHK